MKDIQEKAKLLKPGAIIVTLSKQLESPYFDLMYSQLYNMSWGPCKVHVQQRYGAPKALTADKEWVKNQ